MAVANTGRSTSLLGNQSTNNCATGTQVSTTPAAPAGSAGAVNNALRSSNSSNGAGKDVITGDASAIGNQSHDLDQARRPARLARVARRAPPDQPDRQRQPTWASPSANTGLNVAAAGNTIDQHQPASNQVAASIGAEASPPTSAQPPTRSNGLATINTGDSYAPWQHGSHTRLTQEATGSERGDFPGGLTIIS